MDDRTLERNSGEERGEELVDGSSCRKSLAGCLFSKEEEDHRINMEDMAKISSVKVKLLATNSVNCLLIQYNISQIQVSESS